MRRVPSDAFSYYFGLGARRSYGNVAKHFQVSRRAICNTAMREQWGERLARIEREAQEKSDREQVESLAEVHRRHLATLRAMNARALTALREFPLTNAMDAIRAAELSIKLERLLLDEVSQRVHVDVVATTKLELDELSAEDEAVEGEGRADEPATPNAPPE